MTRALTGGPRGCKLQHNKSNEKVEWVLLFKRLEAT
jgi:hypothetical protein